MVSTIFLRIKLKEPYLIFRRPSVQLTAHGITNMALTRLRTTHTYDGSSGIIAKISLKATGPKRFTGNLKLFRATDNWPSPLSNSKEAQSMILSWTVIPFRKAPIIGFKNRNDGRVAKLGLISWKLEGIDT